MAGRETYWLYEGGMYHWPAGQACMRYTDTGADWDVLSVEQTRDMLRNERFSAYEVGLAEFTKALTRRLGSHDPWGVKRREAQATARLAALDECAETT